MKYKFTIYILLILSFSPQAYASIENNTKLKMFGNAGVAGVAIYGAHADLALCKSMIYPKHLKGDYGESIVGKFFLKQYTTKGQWTSISPRIGRQGIDQLYIKYDKLGRPRDILAGEVKYGSSKLGKTTTGTQMGRTWTNNRLISLGNEYIKVASSKNIKFKSIPSKFGNQHVLEVQLMNGKKAVFWREDSKQPWKYDGPKNQFDEACERSKTLGKYLEGAGKGRIRVRRSIFEVKVENGYVKIIHKDAKQIENGISQNKIKGKTIAKIKVGSQLSKEALQESIAKQIKRKMGHLSDEQCNEMAKAIVKKTKNIENLKTGNFAFAKSVIKNSIKAGVVGAIVTIGMEVLFGEQSYKRLLEQGLIGLGATSTGATVGQITVAYLTKSAIANEAMQQMATSLGLNTSFLSNTVGATAGGAVTAILFAYAGYFLGQYDAYTANLNAISGVIGTGGGMAASVATLSLISSYATAGTGTAISSLSGAAAQNAALAWLGGGTVTSGGGGMAWGSIALGGIFVAAAIATTATAIYCFSLYNQKEDNKVTLLNLKEYCDGVCFINQSRRIYPIKLRNSF